MRYLGGKSRVAKQLAAAILADTPLRGTYREPFIGGAAVFEQMAPHFQRSIGGDVSLDLILLWRDLMAGTFTPPATLSEAEYHRQRDLPPSAMRAFAGFGCSFAGKWFAGYGTGLDPHNDGIDLPNQVARGLKRTQEKLAGLDLTFVREGYETVKPRPGDVIYCDPPYSGTTGYRVEFDNKRFWLKMQQWSDLGAHVYVSELSAPRKWDTIWEKSVVTQTAMPGKRAAQVERLFTRRA